MMRTIMGLAVSLGLAQYPDDGLFQAIRSNDIQLIKNMLASEQKQKLLEYKDKGDEYYNTPLLRTVQMYPGNTEVIQLLVQAGANINVKNTNDGTPLIYCCIDAENRPWSIKTLHALIDTPDLKMRETLIASLYSRFLPPKDLTDIFCYWPYYDTNTEKVFRHLLNKTGGSGVHDGKLEKLQMNLPIIAYKLTHEYRLMKSSISGYKKMGELLFEHNQLYRKKATAYLNALQRRGNQFWLPQKALKLIAEATYGNLEEQQEQLAYIQNIKS